VFVGGTFASQYFEIGLINRYYVVSVFLAGLGRFMMHIIRHLLFGFHSLIVLLTKERVDVD
jgi:hypothetical protein